MFYTPEDSVYGGSESAPSETGLFTQGTMLQVGVHSCVIQRFLSAGGHANIYLVTLLSDGTTRVLKHIALSSAHGPEHRAQIEQEIRFMTQLNGHPQIVGLEAAEVVDSSAYILMEHCPSDALALMNRTLPDSLDETTILHIFSDACKAVAHMHYQQPPLLHRDLKVENILIAQSGYKLCDFGSATADIVSPSARIPREKIVRLEEEIQRSTTFEYRAPEMIDLYLQRGITEKSDIWALGVLLYKLCYFKTPFDNASPLAILNAEYVIPNTPLYSKQLRHLFQMTLREEPRERSTIFTLCTYVCGLRGEPCLLENKYASPPPSPQETTAPNQPRRFAASSSKYATPRGSTIDVSGIAESDSISELDSSGIVPMRRGRPSKRHDGSSGEPARSAPILAPKFRSNAYSSGHTTPERTSKSGSTTPARRHAPTQPAESGNALGIYHEDPDSCSDFASSADDARTPAEVSQMRMSVTSPDGHESLSMDFVQGAVFGSARRASVLRRHPSARSTDGYDDSGSLPTSPSSSLPGFVRQPLPPPPSLPLSPQSDYSAKHTLPTTSGGVTSDIAEECGATYLASMISPLSLGNATPIDTPRSASAATQNDAAVNLRLSTILESLQTEHGQTPNEQEPVRREPRQRAPVKSIYEMTLDKLENDARYSMVFDEQMLFDAKARYAAQRSSVYQSPDNYYYAGKQQQAASGAQTSLGELQPELVDSMLRKMDEYNRQLDGSLPQPRARPAPPDSTAEMTSGESGAIDIDSVIQRVGARNRRKLVAQNNRRSMYVFGGQSAAPGVPEILREDVEDNMRVLSEAEIEELLAKMDEYNRELLSEQQKWQLALGSEVSSPSTANLQSLDRIIEHANDELLRREQVAKDGADTPKAKRAAGILHNVISAAKSTFGKSVPPGAVDTSAICVDTPASCVDIPTSCIDTPTTCIDSPSTCVDEPLSAGMSVVTAADAKSDAIDSAEPEAVTDMALTASYTPLSPLQTEPSIAIVASNADTTGSSIVAPQSNAVETDTMAIATTTESGISTNSDVETTPLSVPAKPPRTYEHRTANGMPETVDADCSSAIPIAATEECAPTPVSPTLPMLPAPPMPSAIAEEAAVSTKVALPPSPIGPDVHDVPKTKTVGSPSTPSTAPAAIPRANDSNKQAPKLPAMPRSQTSVPVDDPLAEVRARLKKKQSSSALPSANASSVAAARAAILGTAESKSDVPALPGRTTPKTPVKSVRNLVAMFEQS
ncbi:Ark- serine/threonine protein kinase [Coemansia pectinata]|uniref:non-specific serine/threonine protein kinase n=1 Tax=Coemansia pectinata TaxID=1052879 RepID=A0A9W8LD97_9FUNG|nr:Ark- serine/threonine protein kinase [Coemansia pectinata]